MLANESAAFPRDDDERLDIPALSRRFEQLEAPSLWFAARTGRAQATSAYLGHLMLASHEKSRVLSVSSHRQIPEQPAAFAAICARSAARISQFGYVALPCGAQFSDTYYLREEAHLGGR